MKLGYSKYIQLGIHYCEGFLNITECSLESELGGGGALEVYKTKIAGGIPAVTKQDPWKNSYNLQDFV